MKLKGSFDAKRLRPREPRNWGARLAAGLSAMLATLGVLLAMAGVAEGRRRSLAFPPALLAAAFFLLNLSGLASEPWSVFSLFLFVPLLPVNSIARAYNRAERIGDQAAEGYSLWNWLAIVLGGGFVMLAFLGLLLR